MSPNSGPPTTGRRAELLSAAVDHVAEHGVGELSLRTLATALGTSHRMLLYHFGSKEELLVEVVRTVEAEQRVAWSGLIPAAGQSPAAVARAFWARFTDPAMAPRERLFFELYGQALAGRPGTTGLLTGVVDDWVEPVAIWGESLGLSPVQARHRARLGVAVTRGLLLDLLATGERAAVDAAMEEFIALYIRDLPATWSTVDSNVGAQAGDEQPLEGKEEDHGGQRDQ